MPETPEEMRKRIEEEERIRLEVRQKLEAESPRKPSPDRHLAQAYRGFGCGAFVLALASLAMAFVVAGQGGAFFLWLGLASGAFGVVLLVLAWVRGYS